MQVWYHENGHLQATEIHALPPEDDDIDGPLVYAWYGVGMPTLAFVMHFFDRLVVALPVESIRRN